MNKIEILFCFVVPFALKNNGINDTLDCKYDEIKNGFRFIALEKCPNNLFEKSTYKATSLLLTCDPSMQVAPTH